MTLMCRQPGCGHASPVWPPRQVADSECAPPPLLSGGSPSWLFRVRTNKTASGWAVVKTWCVPVLKIKQRGLAPCHQKKVYSQVKLLLSQQKVRRRGGASDFKPRGLAWVLTWG